MPQKNVKKQIAPLETDIPEELTTIESAKRMLAQCVDIPSTKKVLDTAKGLEVMARRAKMSTEAVQAAMEVKVVAYQRLGQMLKTIIKNTGNAGKGRPKKGDAVVVDEENPIKRIEDYGITRNESSQCQKIAELDTTEFSILRKGEVSIAKALRLHAKKLKDEKILNTEVKIPSAKRKKFTFSDKIDEVKCETLIINELLSENSDDLKGALKKINNSGANFIFVITHKNNSIEGYVKKLPNYKYKDLIVWQDSKLRDQQMFDLPDSGWVKSIRFVFMFVKKDNQQSLDIDKDFWREDFFSGSLSNMYYNLVRISTKARQLVFDVFCDFEASGARAAMVNKSYYFGYNNDNVNLKMSEQSLAKWFEQNDTDGK